MPHLPAPEDKDAVARSGFIESNPPPRKNADAWKIALALFGSALSSVALFALSQYLTARGFVSETLARILLSIAWICLVVLLLLIHKALQLKKTITISAALLLTGLLGGLEFWASSRDRNQGVPSKHIASLTPPGIPGPNDDVYLPSVSRQSKPTVFSGPFAVYLGNSELRQKEGFGEGLFYADSTSDPFVLNPLDYLTHISIVNRQSFASSIVSYSIVVRTNKNTWRPLRRVFLFGTQLYFVHHFGPQLSAVRDISLLDDRILERTVEPGGIVSGFAMFSYCGQTELAVSDFTRGEGIYVGQFPLSDIRISVRDALGHEIVNAEAGYESSIDSANPKTVHFGFGPPLQHKYRISNYHPSCGG